MSIGPPPLESRILQDRWDRIKKVKKLVAKMDDRTRRDLMVALVREMKVEELMRVLREVGGQLTGF